jgi:multiple sugar transport system permease protein
MTGKQRKDLRMGLLFISPWIVGFAVFGVYPIAMAIYYSFCDYDVLRDPVWVGSLNYQDMVTDDVFWKSLYNTLFYTLISVPMSLTLALLIAVLLNRPILGRSLFRTFFYIPAIVPLVAVSMIWIWVFQGETGLLNYGIASLGRSIDFVLHDFVHINVAMDWINGKMGTGWHLGRVTLEGPQWLTDATWTKPTLILSSVWQIGGAMVLFLAGLQDVPRSLYESADLDGAGPMQQFRHITIPMVSPVLYFNLVMGIILSIQEFVKPFIMMADGGENRSALLFAVYIYQNAFQYNNMGYACAMAVILFLMILVLTWLATRAMAGHVHYGGD